FDRGSQAREAQLLGLTLDLEIELLRPQAHITPSRDTHSLRVEHDAVGAHETVLDVELRDAAANVVALFVAFQQEPETARNVDAGELSERRSHFAMRQDDRRATVRVSHDIVERVTFPR